MKNLRERIKKSRLRVRLYNDIEQLGLPTDFDLELRGYSKCYHGLYDPNIKKVIVYPLDVNKEYLPYEEILEVAVHEAIHHYQWSSKSFKRVKGVMHNTEFKALENEFKSKMEEIECQSQDTRVSTIY